MKSKPSRHRDTYQKALCKASTHQGDPAIFNPNSIGRQCLPNCLIACSIAASEEPSSWTIDTMDYILHEGDKLYSKIDVGHDLLLPTDLPTCVHIRNSIIHLVLGKQAFGSFANSIMKTIKMLSVLCTFVMTTNTSTLLCLGNKTGSSAVTVLSRNTSMYIFDSHSRDSPGLPCANGSAVLIKFNDIGKTVSFICELADKLSAKLFHWTFWHAIPGTECDCDTSLDQNAPAVDVLCEEEIMKLYSELVPEELKQTNMTNYYRSYKQRARLLETPKQTSQRRNSDKLYRKTSRADETPQQTKDHQQLRKN